MTKVTPKLGRPAKDGSQLSEGQKQVAQALATPDLYVPPNEVLKLKARFQNRLRQFPKIAAKETDDLTARDIAKVCGLSTEYVNKTTGGSLDAINTIIDRNTVDEQEKFLWELALKRMETVLLKGSDKDAGNIIKLLASVNKRLPDSKMQFNVDAGNTRVMNMGADELKAYVAAKSKELGLLQEAEVLPDSDESEG